VLVTIASGCSGAHSALDPAGPQAGRIAHIYWIYFAVCVAAYVLTMFFMVGAALMRRGREPVSETHVEPKRPDVDHRLGIVVSACVGATTIILFILLFYDFLIGRSIHQFSNSDNPVTITLTGHQWWWEVRYEDADPSSVFETANEIVIPTGRPVRIWLQSGDVIHSFWIPNLHGKKDLIPQHSTSIWLQADKPGRYYGQCAEFCGYEHAMMRLLVKAMPYDQFDNWLKAARSPAPLPMTDMQKRGQQVFMSSSCVMCHSIGGTKAGGRVGPDLTHVASREMIGAGEIPNMPGHLAGWVIDTQRVKPGVRMPQNNLPASDVPALLEYLETLK